MNKRTEDELSLRRTRRWLARPFWKVLKQQGFRRENLPDECAAAFAMVHEPVGCYQPRVMVFSSGVVHAWDGFHENPVWTDSIDPDNKRMTMNRQAETLVARFAKVLRIRAKEADTKAARLRESARSLKGRS
jgi:hypothetical protein